MTHPLHVSGDDFSVLLSRLPEGLDLDGLAHTHEAIERGREIKDGATLLRLALARGPGGLSLRETAAWASAMGVARLSNPAVKYRLDKAAAFLAAVTDQLLAARAASVPLLWPGRSLRLADGTCISKPGSTGIDWRVHGVFDLGAGGFSHLELTDAKGAESILRGAPVPGEVRIADRYYGRAAGLQAFSRCRDGSDSGGPVDFIARVGWNALRLQTPEGAPFDLTTHLEALPQSEAVHDCAVQAMLGDGSALKLRLVILRKPAAAAEATVAKLLGKARRRHKQLDPRSLIAARFVILATSLPVEGYPPDQILSVYRLRWQIELAFKRLKSLLHIDRLPTLSERASRSWLLAHLILALLCDDLSQEVLELFP